MAGQGITATGFDDADGLELAEPEWFWEGSTDGTTWNPLADGIGLAVFTPTADHIGQQIRARVVYEDDLGGEGEVVSLPTDAVLAAG